MLSSATNEHVINKKIQRFFDKDILAFRSNALWRILDLLMSISTREACSQKIRSDVDRILAAETIYKKTIYLIVTTCKVGAVVMGYFVFGPDFQMKSHNSSSGALWSISQKYAQAHGLGFPKMLRPNLKRDKISPSP